MEKELRDILNDVPTQPGYSFEELESCLADDEIQCILGYAFAIYDLQFIENPFEDAQAAEKYKETIQSVVEYLKLNLSCLLVVFGDNHPDEDIKTEVL